MPVTLETQNAFVCTPSSLLASNPCMACLSEKQLLAALVGIMAQSLEESLPDVLKNSACFMCMSKKQMLQALVSIVGNSALGDSESPQSVIDTYHCLVCASEKQLQAAFLWLLCHGFEFTRAEQQT
jgi:hypothetical protein